MKVDLRIRVSNRSARSAGLFLLVLLSVSALTGCRLLHAGPDVAFLGDSLTYGWSYPTVNYGVRGNTTGQMVARFPNVIPGHGYTTVVILGGTNDVLQGVSPETTVHNLQELGEETVAQHAEPILCEIPPIFHNFSPMDKTVYGPKVMELNRRIAILALEHHWKLIDYYDGIAEHSNYSSDGVHMKRRGYLAMERALLRTMPAF